MHFTNVSLIYASKCCFFLNSVIFLKNTLQEYLYRNRWGKYRWPWLKYYIKIETMTIFGLGRRYILNWRALACPDDRAAVGCRMKHWGQGPYELWNIWYCLGNVCQCSDFAAAALIIADEGSIRHRRSHLLTSVSGIAGIICSTVWMSIEEKSFL